MEDTAAEHRPKDHGTDASAEAARKLLEKTYPLLWKLANHLHRKGGMYGLQPEDVVQETSIRILKYGGNYDEGRSSPSAYVSKIFKQCILAMRKGASYKITKTVGAEFIDSHHENNGRVNKKSNLRNQPGIAKSYLCSSGTETSRISKSMSKTVRKALLMLDPKDRALLEERFASNFDGKRKSLREIASREGVSFQGVAHRQAMALRELRRKLLSLGVNKTLKEVA